jgi:hypothetical protein
MSLGTSSLSDQLPLFQRRDFEISFNKFWPIGIDSDYPSDLRVRLSAASASYQMGNKSIDSVVKRYFKDFACESSSADRLDKKISRSLKEAFGKLDEAIGPLAPERPVLGQMVAKWTFMRIPFSVDLAITCAQRGALFECLAIVRMILEQIAWSLDIRLLDDFRAITSRQASQSIGAIKPIHPSVGQFYGWLSAHAHWTYDAHIKAFQATNETIGMVLANPLHKAQALGAVLVLFDIAQEAYRCLLGTLGWTVPPDGASAMNASYLIRELQSLAPQDEDIQLLLKMAEMKHGEG